MASFIDTIIATLSEEEFDIGRYTYALKMRLAEIEYLDALSQKVGREKAKEMSPSVPFLSEKEILFILKMRVAVEQKNFNLWSHIHRVALRDFLTKEHQAI